MQCLWAVSELSPQGDAANFAFCAPNLGGNCFWDSLRWCYLENYWKSVDACSVQWGKPSQQMSEVESMKVAGCY